MPIPKLLFFPERSPTGSRRLQLLQESKFSTVQRVRADHDLVCNVRQDQQLASTAQAAGHEGTWRIHSDRLWQACHDLELMQFYGHSMIKAPGGVRKKCSVLTKQASDEEDGLRKSAFVLVSADEVPFRHRRHPFSANPLPQARVHRAHISYCWRTIHRLLLQLLEEVEHSPACSNICKTCMRKSTQNPITHDP